MPHHFKTMRKWIKAAWLWVRIVGRVDQTGMRMGWLTACEVCRIVHLDWQYLPEPPRDQR